MTHRVSQIRFGAALVRGAVLPVALALGAGAWQSAQAVDVGHARILSGAGQPLRLVVPLTGLSRDEAATLAVRLADAAAWQQSGLTPPVALAGLNGVVRPGANASRRDLIVSATEAPRGDVVDMLLELETSAEQRRIQVSFVVPTHAAPGVTDVRLPRAGAAGRADSVTVRRGDTLSGLAQKHRYTGISLYQMLVAIYQTNPQAFVQGNMNRVKTGATLAIPDAETVRAIDPAEARRLFLAHSAAFARYRTAMADTASVVAGGTPASGQLRQAPEPLPERAVAAGDRVQLTSGMPSAGADQMADEQIARARAEQDLAARVAQLERNIGDIYRALTAGRDTQDTRLDSTATNDVALPAASAASSPVQDAAGASLAVDADAAAATAALDPPTALTAADSPEAGQSSSSWWLDNLLVLITGGLAILALVVAWVMRRAGGRGNEQRDDDGDSLAGNDNDDAPVESSDAMHTQFAHRLESIDLELIAPPDANGLSPQR